MVNRLQNKLEWALWFLLIFLLPITSMPLVGQIVGSPMVAPPSLLLLVLLLVIWLLPALFKKTTLPGHLVPLLAFLCAAALSAIAAHFIPIPSFRQTSILRNEIEILATLVIGACFYLAAAAWPINEQRLEAILRWINWSGLLVLAWSFTQAIFWYWQKDYPGWMEKFQEFISISQLFPQRVTGFAFEPSWLAHQLNMFFLPFWLAASIRHTSAHRRHILGINLENILLVGGVIVLWLSLSRIGLLTLLAMIAYLMILANIRLIQWLRSRFVGGKVSDSMQKQHIRQRLATAGLTLAVLMVYIGLFFGTAYTLSKVDPNRMGRLFDISLLKEGKGFNEWANQLVFAERVVFWQVGWDVFNDYPVLGVGPGNAGYFFPKKMSSFGWSLTETSTVMYQMSSIPNTKSLWIRLLAETGILGFAVFISWLFVLWVSFNHLHHQESRRLGMVALAGKLLLIGLLVEGFSIDSFALPYYWLTLGLATAAFRISQKPSIYHSKDIN